MNVLVRVYAHGAEIAEDGQGVWLLDTDRKRVSFVAVRHGVESVTCIGCSNITVP